MKFLFSILLFQYHFNTNGPYIKLEYIGNSDKPIPAILFREKGIDLVDSLGFTKIFKISTSEFEFLKSSLKQNNRIFEKTITRFFRVAIYDKKVENYFYLKNKSSTKKAFDKLLYGLRNNKKRNKIKEDLKQILKRI